MTDVFDGIQQHSMMPLHHDAGDLQAVRHELAEDQSDNLKPCGQQHGAHERNVHNRIHHQGAAKQAAAWPVLQSLPDQQPQPDEVPSTVQQRAAQYAGDEGLARPPTRPPSDWRPRALTAEADEDIAPMSLQADQEITR